MVAKGGDAPREGPHKQESSGVMFSNINRKYWRIGNKYYDFNRGKIPWLDRHPGGRQVLELARDRFDDCTYAFEAYHPDYVKAREILKKYEVEGLTPPPSKTAYPELCGDKSFYSVLRLKVAAYLKAAGGPGPSAECLRLWWVVLTCWCLGFATVVATGSFLAAVVNGIIGAWLGGFGHNFVHQPTYRLYGYSLDLLGFSSEGWFREHNLQHHMYTNTPLDNHYHGTEPFIKCCPTTGRNWFQRYVTSYVNWFFIFFGTEANWLAHFVDTLKGNENLTVGKVFVPLEIYALAQVWGLYRAVALWMVMAGTCSVYYFTIALMNHNTENAWNVKQRNQAMDWGHQQLCSSADIDVGLTFHQSIRYLWLNYHTVHHLFPNTDMCHHPKIQQLMLETAKEFKIKYECGSFWPMWWEMVQSFSEPRWPGMEVILYP